MAKNDQTWSVDSIIAELQEHEKDAGAQMIENMLNDDEPEKVAAEEEAEPIEGDEVPEEEPEKVKAEEEEPEKSERQTE